MDRFEKHAEYIMNRGDKLLAEKKRKEKNVRRISFSLSGVIVTIIAGFFVWRSAPSLDEKPFGIVESESTSVISSTNAQVTAEATQTAATTVNDNSVVSVKSTGTTTAEKQALTTSTVVSDIKNAITKQQTSAASTNITVSVTTAQAADTQAQEPSATETEQIVETVSELTWGYFSDNDSSETDRKSLPSQNIAMKCKSFCASGEKLTVDVAMGNARMGSQDNDTSEGYKFEVYLCDPTDLKGIEDEKLIVNGKHRRYRKEYSDEDIKLFDTNGRIDDYNSYHHETTEIDFSDYEVGSSGWIKFTFTVEHNGDPFHTAYTAANQYMYFCVGEEGTVISNKNVECEKYKEYSDNKDGCGVSSPWGHHKRH